MGLIRTNLAEIKLLFVAMRSKNFLDINSDIMVWYERHNIHFRKSCAYLKYFIQLKYYTVNGLHRSCMCVCFQNSKNSQLHKPLELSGMHGNANDNLLRVGYYRK